MLPEYAAVIIQILLAVGFAVGTLVASAYLGKRALSNRTKDSSYECGMVHDGGGQARFSIKFYLVAMLFVLFDVEVVFLIPWATIYRAQIESGAGIFLVSVLGFIGILFVAYLYALKKGAFNWQR